LPPGFVTYYRFSIHQNHGRFDKKSIHEIKHRSKMFLTWLHCTAQNCTALLKQFYQPPVILVCKIFKSNEKFKLKKTPLTLTPAYRAVLRSATLFSNVL